MGRKVHMLTSYLLLMILNQWNPSTATLLKMFVDHEGDYVEN